MELIFDETPVAVVDAAQAATMLGVAPSRIKQFGNDNALVVLKQRGELFIPELLLEVIPEGELQAQAEDEGEDSGLPPATHRPLWNAKGTLTLLADAGYSNNEMVAWLWRVDGELKERPIEALVGGRHHAVNRVAGSLGF